MLIDDEHKQLHWRRSARIVAISLFVLLGVALLPPLVAELLPNSSFLRFQLGFFLVVHGGVAGIIATVYWFNTSQEAADRTFNITSHT